MEQEIILDVLSRYDKYLYFIVSIIYLFFAFFFRKKEIWRAIIGKNKKLELTELAAFYWFAFFPILFFGDLILDLQAHENLWTAFELIFITTILGHSAISIWGKNGKKNEKSKNNTEFDTDTSDTN